MAFIGHRCACGHNDIQHTDGTTSSIGTCTADCGRDCKSSCSLELPEPEVMPSFDIKGNSVERILPPGDGFRAMGDHQVVTTCRCDACQALYAQLAPAA